MTASKERALRILVVEDEPVIAKICQRVLRSEGFEVDIAASGRAAQDLANKNRYALYLVGIKMPVISGEEF